MIRTSEKIDKEDWEFWKTNLVKSIVMFGFTYFSVALSMQTLANILPSIIAASLYFFTEGVRYYELNPQKKEVTSKSKRKHYNFLI